MSVEENLLLQSALAAARRGWKVFPCWWIEDGACACEKKAECDRPGKHPIARHAPQGLKDATTDAETIRRWWTLTPNANPAMRTGDVTVVDVDGPVGEITFTKLCGPHGGWPQTYKVKTGNGSHLYFKSCERLKTGNNRLGEKVDVKNENGYVMLPPSSHASGNIYAVVADVPLLDVPEWMSEPEQPRRGPGRPKKTTQLTLEQIASALDHIDPDDRDRWRNVGVILGRTFSGTPAESEALEMYRTWSRKSPKYDDDPDENEDHMRRCFSEWSQEEPRAGRGELKMGSLIKWARDGGWLFEGVGVEAYDDFYAVEITSLQS